MQLVTAAASEEGEDTQDVDISMEAVTAAAADISPGNSKYCFGWRNGALTANWKMDLQGQMLHCLLPEWYAIFAGSESNSKQYSLL